VDDRSLPIGKSHSSDDLKSDTSIERMWGASTDLHIHSWCSQACRPHLTDGHSSDDLKSDTSIERTCGASTDSYISIHDVPRPI